MKSEIKRYECDMFGPYEVADGRFVLYEEHAKIVAELKLEIHKARSEGVTFGQAAGFRMGLARAIKLVDLELAK